MTAPLTPSPAEMRAKAVTVWHHQTPHVEYWALYRSTTLGNSNEECRILNVADFTSLLDSLDAAKVDRDEARSMLALVATKSSLLCAWHAHFGVFSKNPHVIHADLCGCDVEVKQLRAKAALRAALVAPATGRA